MQLEDSQLIDFLTDAELVTDAEIADVKDKAEDSNQSVADALVSEGIMESDELRRVQAHVLGFPFVSLKEKDIDFETLSLIPEPVARNHSVVAYNDGAEGLEVAVLDPDDLRAIDFVKKKTGKKVQARLTDRESMQAVLRQYQESLDTEFQDLIEEESGAIETIDENKEEVSEEKLEEMAEDLPVVRVVETLLKHAILQDASDIHIEPMENQVLVRYRIDGILHDVMELPAKSSQSIVARIKVLADLKLDEKRLPQDGRFKVDMEGEEVSLRVSIIPTQYGEKTVMRLLRQNVEGYTLESLGFHGKALERIHKSANQSTGMVLTTGPTGSGKTTTLYTIMDMLNTPRVNISTVEDPVEYQMKRINQTQVKPDIGFDFSEGLRSLVRQDPDIIMVGEIRDEETAHLAVNAALTGHLVFSTLHTNSAAGAIPRLLDMGAEAFLLTSTINVLIGQRLVRKLCRSKEAYTLDDAELDRLAENIDMDKVLKAMKDENLVADDKDWKEVEFYKAVKTEDCPDGYSGRLGIQEALPMTTAISDLVMADATADEIEDQARDEGMLTMAEDGIFKAVQGQTTIEEVFRVVNE